MTTPPNPKANPTSSPAPTPGRGATDNDIYQFALRLEGTEAWSLIEAQGYQRAVVAFARSLQNWTGEKVFVELKYYLESFSISLYEIWRDADGVIRGVGAGRVTFSSEGRPKGAY